MSETVELHPAHMWDCPECGIENFCRGILIEMTQEEKRELLAQEYGVEPFDILDEDLQGDFMTAPEQVKCSSCGKEFNSRDQRESEE